jgi:hypothetical protein
MTFIRAACLSLLVLTAAAIPTSAFALGLGYGAKIGFGSGQSTNDDAPDTSLTAGLLVLNLDLMAVAIEGNLGFHRMTVDDANDTYNDELSVVAIVKTGIPIIPAVLSLDFGAGIDQRILIGSTSGGTEADSVSGSRTLVPVSVQASGTVLLARLYGEIRYNHEIASSFEVDGTKVESDDKLH